MEKQREVYGIIYVIRNKVNNKLYIGQTIDKKGFNGRYKENGKGIERVYNHHKKRKNRNERYNEHLLYSIDKYGFEAFEINECFDMAYSQEELNKLEYMYIEIYKCRNRKFGYNNKYGGSNGKLSEETKEKLRKANSGENSPNYGKHLSEERKQKLRECNLGKKVSEETKKKISESKKGKYKGENNPNYGNGDKIRGGKNPSARPIYCYEFNQIRLTTKDWCDMLNLNMAHILQCCNGELKSTGGFHFRDATEEEINNYKEEDNIIIDEEKINFIKTKAKLINPMGRCIYCIELNIVAFSIKEMQKITGATRKEIIQCCEEKKLSKNYNFRYATEEEIDNRIMEIINIDK